jgi:hypothetical protein
MREYLSQRMVADVPQRTSGDVDGYENDYRIPKTGIIVAALPGYPSL